MSSPFSRTMRSLHADSFRPALIGLIVAIILLVAWGTWFFFAQVTLYEKSQSAHIRKGEIIVAEFPAESLSRIQQGQSARLYIEGPIGQQAGSIPALVTDVISPSKNEQKKNGEVRLFAFADANSPIRSQDELTGQIEIEVERLSPAQLVMRISGVFVETPKVSFSPQKSSVVPID